MHCTAEKRVQETVVAPMETNAPPLDAQRDSQA
ncbi:hypothetical protein G1C94_1082 [Bifidobacterium sp. DSM 109963]|uniref:Uncharacterized protein n=1 Tax=Bifidobacterium panos TaxID=2675321 RepID=A0ABX1SXA9_9BIFI|nr:hypothetical protein [Bifidobacterium sp. DSM 109963]